MPLGEVLADTVLEVRHGDGHVLRGQGEGELWMGGPGRMCFLGTLPATGSTWQPTIGADDVMATGDLVYQGSPCGVLALG